MNEEPPRDKTEFSNSPFDDLPDKNRGSERTAHLSHFAAVLRILSALALAFALVTAARVVLLDVAQWIHPNPSYNVNSALPLIGIGVSYALLQVTLPCTIGELLLSLAVSAAFIMWGLEKYLPARVATYMDDMVVFLFVLDLGLVIRGRLKRSFEKGE